MPFVASTESSPTQPELTPLFLPSSFANSPSPVPLSMIGLGKLREVEAELRFAHAAAALDFLRRHLLMQVHYQHYTRTNVRGQCSSTRSQTLIQQTSVKVQTFASQYRRARDAYLLLKGHGPWEDLLRPLASQDIRPLSERHITRERSEGRQSISWIWYNSQDLSDSTLDEGEVCVFWLVCC